MAHLPKSGPRDGNDRSIEMADSQAYLILVYTKIYKYEVRQTEIMPVAEY